MEAYHGSPKWLDDKLFDKGHFTSEETDDVNSENYMLDTEYILNL